MSSVFDPVVHALESRLLGSGEFHSGDDLLDKVLSLQYRVHYHIFGNNVKTSVCKVLLDESSKLTTEEPLHRKILFNLVGILHHHLNDQDNATRYLQDAKKVGIDFKPFQTFLDLENLYYLGLGTTSKDVYKKLFNVISTIPKESHALTFHYLNLITKELSLDWSTANSMFPQSPLTYYIALKSDPTNHDKELLVIGDSYLASAHFPKAEEFNDSQLENFHVFLQYYMKSLDKVSSEWSKFIISSMSKTFQSINVAKVAMIYFSKKNVKESILNFTNFINYNSRFYELNNKNYYDVVSVIDAYNHVLSHVKNSHIEGKFSISDALSQFHDLLKQFYGNFGIPLIIAEKSSDWLSNSPRLILPQVLSSTLSRAWYTFYQHRSTSLHELLSNHLVYYLANAMTISSKDEEVKFQYAYTLAQQRQIELAVKFIKNEILEANPENYKSWHLLALCESIKENKDTAFKIVSSVLQAMQEAYNENKLGKNDRWQFIHLKLTQLGVIDDMFGVNDSLELLPEVFELFADLFPESEQIKLGSEPNQTKEYLLQAIWLFACKLYLRNGNFKEAQDALKESLNVKTDFKNLNNNLARGYLSLQDRNSAALTEFESVLFYDPMNVDAIVGFAKLIFPEVGETADYKQSPLQTQYKTDQIFANDEDRSAACASLKLMLEQVIENSIDGYHSPEIWWYLSQIYEQYGDSDRLEASLWNCVKFEELEPIRDFKNCNF